MPYIRVPKIKDETRTAVDNHCFYGEADNQCYDRVLLVEGMHEGYNIRRSLFQAATQSINIAYYKLDRGDSTQALLLDIYEAANRGVQVQILLDGIIGNGLHGNKLLERFTAHPNISYKVFNPPNFWRPWGLNSIMHDKIILVDDSFVLSGGRNIGDRYFKPTAYAGEMTYDREVLVWRPDNQQASVITQVKQYFDELWTHSLSKTIRSEKSLEADDLSSLEEKYQTFVQANPDFYNNSLDYYLSLTKQVTKISFITNPIDEGPIEPRVAYILSTISRSAEQSVLIQTPYATANNLLLNTLTDIVSRVNQVEVLTNSIGTSPNLLAFSNYFTQRKKFVETGVTFHEYQGANSIHAKSMVVDGRISAVGTFNMDNRSLSISTENMLIIDSVEIARDLTGAMEDYMAQSLVVDTDDNYIPNPSVPEREYPPIKKDMIYISSIFSRLFYYLI